MSSTGRATGNVRVLATLVCRCTSNEGNAGNVNDTEIVVMLLPLLSRYFVHVHSLYHAVVNFYDQTFLSLSLSLSS